MAALGRMGVIALLAVVFAGDALAQGFPNRHLTMVVPFAAGGPTDVLARHLGQAMGAALNQQIAIENVNGAGGTIGTARVAKAQPDGYTVLLMHIGIATAPALYRKLPYDAINDLEPIGRVADVPMTMVATKKLPPNGLKEFLTYATANKDKLNYANAARTFLLEPVCSIASDKFEVKLSTHVLIIAGMNVDRPSLANG